LVILYADNIKIFAGEEGRLIEVIQVILENIKIYFELFVCLVFLT